MKPAFLLSALASGLLIGGALVMTTASVLPATVPVAVVGR
jgi:hypothetical protein